MIVVSTRAVVMCLTVVRQRHTFSGLALGLPRSAGARWHLQRGCEDRKSTRLNSSHTCISYAVFCLNDTATTEIYTLSLHDALPISDKGTPSADWHWACPAQLELVGTSRGGVRCLTGVRQRHTFSGLFTALSLSRWRLWAPSRGRVTCSTGVRQRHTFSGLFTGLTLSSWSS